MSRREPKAAPADEFLARFRETGDPEALGALFDATGAALFRLALTLAPDAAAAEDAVQETFLAAMQSVGKHDPLRPALPWLVGILHHRVSRIRRRSGRTPDPGRMMPPVPIDDPAAVAADREETERVRAALDALPEPYRRVALLRWRHGLSPAEIAALDRTAPGTVRSLLHRAREKLRKGIEALPGLLLLGPRERTARGLCAVRSELVATARRAASATALSTGAVAGGTLMAKKSVVVGIGLLLLAAGWIAFDPLGGKAANPPAGRMSATLAGPKTPAADDAAGAAPVSVSTRSPAAPATGFVVDAAGDAVAGAEVVAVSVSVPGMLPPDQALREGGPGFRAVADVAGRFEIALPEGAPLATVLARADGFAPGYVDRVYPGQSGIRIRLGRPDALFGIVRDADGNPVPRALVRVSAGVGAFRIDREATSDASGRYRVEGIPGERDPAELLVSVRAEGYAPIHKECREAGPLDLWLTRGFTLRGRVVDEGSGHPVKGAEVVLYTIENSSTRETGDGRYDRLLPSRVFATAVSDSDGSFRFEGVPATGGDDPRKRFAPSLFFNVDPEGRPIFGYVGARAEGHAAAVEQVLLRKEGEVVETTLRLRSPAALDGRVVDAAGEPVADAFVSYETEGGGRPSGGFAGFPASWTRTGEDGRFRFDGIPVAAKGPTLLLLNVSRGFSGYRNDPEEHRVEVFARRTTGLGDVVLSEPPWPTVEFRVVGPDGEPVWGAGIEGFGVKTRTGPNGRATWRSPVHQTVPEGAELPVVTFTVHARGLARSRVDVRPSRSKPSEVAVPLEAGHVLGGRVRAYDGTPAAGARVAVMDASVPAAEAFRPERGRFPHLVAWGRCDADGRFLVEDLPAGPFHVRASGIRNGEIRPDVPADTRDLGLSLPFTATIAGRVLEGATDAAVDDFRVVLVAGRRSFPETRPRAGPGRFRFEGVPPGEWTLRVSSDSHANSSVPLVVEDGQDPPPIDVRLSRGATVRGRLLLPAGTDFTGARVWFASVEEPLRSAGAEVGADGTYEIMGLLPGRYGVTLWKEREVLVPRGAPIFELPAGRETARYDAEMGPGGRLSVKSGVGEERTEIRTGAGTLLATVPGGSDRVIHSVALPAGEYEVSRVRDGAVAEVRRVTIRAGERTASPF